MIVLDIPEENAIYKVFVQAKFLLNSKHLRIHTNFVVEDLQEHQ